MYASHFGFSDAPFDLTPNPAYLYLGKQYRDALGALQYGLADQRGFMTLIGEVGTGKTTIIHSLLADLPEGIVATFISYANQPFPSLLSLLLRNLGVLHDPAREAEMLIALDADLRYRAHKGQTVALIVDEAQNLSEEMLERLRILSNLESTETKLLQIILVGQPELGRKLHRYSLRQLNERVSVRAYLKPLPRRELKAYVKHRVARAGGELHALTTPLARWLLLRRAWGIPRRVNILFHNALLYAFGRGARRLTAPVAFAAIQEMNDRPVRRFLLSVIRRPAWGAAVATAILALALLFDRYTDRTARSTPVTTGGPPIAAREAAPTPPAPAPVEIARLPEAPRVEKAPPAPPAKTPTVDAPEEESPRADAPEVAAAPSPPPPRRPHAEVVLVVPKTPPPPEALATGHHADPLSHDAREVQIVPGATLSSIAREIYGYLPTGAEFVRYTGRIKELNPWIRDPDLIFADRTLRVPTDATSEGNETP
jgi:general secretion pathway protein A